MIGMKQIGKNLAPNPSGIEAMDFQSDGSTDQSL